MFESRVHANDLRVRFAVYQTGKAVERRASYTRAGVHSLSVFLIEQYAKRQGKRMIAQPLEIIVEFLNSRFVAHWRITVRCTEAPFRRIDSVFPVDVIKILGLRIIRLEVIVVQWPRGRNAGVMSDFTEVLRAKSQQGRAVDLGVRPGTWVTF
jgi:hypothetical protein